MSNPGQLADPQPENSGWGQATAYKKLELPSGSVATVKELEIVELVELDILDKVDGFSGKALQEPGKKGKKKGVEAAALAEQLKDMMSVLDKVVIAAVVSPRVYPKPRPATEDQEAEEVIPGRAYVNLISVGDKMEIFNYSIKGMQEFFRLGGEQGPDVGAVETKSGDGVVSD